MGHRLKLHGLLRLKLLGLHLLHLRSLDDALRHINLCIILANHILQVALTPADLPVRYKSIQLVVLLHDEAI